MSRYTGRLLWKKEWYSLCGIHRDYNEKCHLCNAGNWHYIIITKFSKFIYNNYPNFWIWAVNSNKLKNIKNLIKK